MPKAKAKTYAELVTELFAAMPPSYCDEYVGERIARRRKELGLTQKVLALAGCSVSTLSLVENGYRTPSMHLLHRFSYVLDISPVYLAWGRGPKATGGRMQRYSLLFLGVQITELDLANARKRALAEASK